MLALQDQSEAVLAGPTKENQREAKLLIQEAEDTLGKTPKRRAESNVYVRRWTGERMLREQPRRFRLIASMRREGLGVRQTCRAAHCDARTVHSVEALDSEAMPTVKKRLTGLTARIARMSLERIEEEIPHMPVNLLGMTAGIAIDKLQTLTGDPNQRIAIDVTDNRAGNIFDRISQLHGEMAKVIQAKVIEPEPLQIEGT